MKGLKKLGSLFLVAIFLLVGIANVKAYDNTNIVSNNNIDWNLIGKDEDSKDIKREDYITLKNDLKNDSAKVSIQFIGITEQQFNDIGTKYDAFVAARDSQTATQAEKEAAMNAYIASIPNFDDTKWEQTTLKESTTTGNQYNAKLDETKDHFVIWVKIEIGSTVTYGYNVSCLANIPRSCEPYNGKWYNKKGEPVTEAEYLKECQKCTTPNNSNDGKYHDANGQITDEAGYRKACNPNCEPKDGEYYDDYGNPITKSQFDKLCGNPKTGNQTFYMYGIVTVGIAFVLYMFTRKIRKFSK